MLIGQGNGPFGQRLAKLVLERLAIDAQLVGEGRGHQSGRNGEDADAQQAAALATEQAFGLIVGLADAQIRIEPLPEIVSDRLALEQIFSNLIDNALKYLKNGVPGDIVILFRALSNVHEYESALRRYGLDYYLVGGKTFFAQQEIFDLLHAHHVPAAPVRDTGR